MPCATSSTTPSIITATKRIQNPAGLLETVTRTGEGAGAGGGTGGEAKGPRAATGGVPRSAPHREQYRAFSPCHPQR
jgi:hypothetical protein